MFKISEANARVKIHTFDNENETFKFVKSIFGRWCNPTKIIKNHKIIVDNMTLQEAKNKGAIALFGEKYPEKVRVITFNSTKDNELVSNFSEFFNPHLIFLNIASKLTNFFGFNNYFLFRLPNFIYLGLLIFVSYKIIKLKFYDLNYLMPLTAVMLSGTILISMITIDGSLISGLVTLLIFYYLLKIL